MSDYPRIDPSDVPPLPEGVTIPEGYERWYGGEAPPRGLMYIYDGLSGWNPSTYMPWERVPLTKEDMMSYIAPIRKVGLDHVPDATEMVLNPLAALRGTVARQLAEAEKLAELQARKIERLRMKLELLDEIIEETDK